MPSWTPAPYSLPYITGLDVLEQTPSTNEAQIRKISQYLASVATPIGTVQMYARLTPPQGWLLCDGGVVDKVLYPELHEALESDGYPYGGDAAGARVPDLRGRVAAGAGQGVGGGATGAAGTVPSGGVGLATRTPGTWGGDERMHEHDHGGTTGDDSPDHTHTTWSGFFVKTGGGLVGAAGGNFIDVTNSPDAGPASTRHQHSIEQDGTGTQQNLMPYMTLNFIILATNDL